MSRQQRSNSPGLPIRVRRVIARSGSETSQATVFCPRQGKSLMLDDCKICERYCGTGAEAEAGGSSLICSHGCNEPVERPAALKPRSRGISAKALNASVAEIMTREVLCVRQDLRVDDLVLLLVEHGVSGVPVVNENGKAVGIVSRADLLWESYDEVEARSERTQGQGLNGEDSARFRTGVTVGEIMSRSAVTVSESTTIAEAAAVMARHGVHRAPVVDQNATVVGIVSAGDLLVWIARSAGYPAPARFPRRK